jgi:hypothetical protein
MKNTNTPNRNDSKLYILLFGIAIPLLIAVNQLTSEKLTNGYHFLFFFLSILPMVYFFDLIMINTIKQEAKKGPNPFYLMKYVTYVFLALFSTGPLLYLWSMREVIAQLKW